MLEKFNYNKIIKRIDYSEFILFTPLCILIIVNFLSLYSVSFVFFSLMAIFSLIIFYLEAFKNKKHYLSYISILFSGLLISATNFNMVFIFSLAVVVTLRLLKSPKSELIKLIFILLLSIASIPSMSLIYPNLQKFIVSINGLTEVNIILPSILIITFLYIIFEFIKSRLVNRDALIDVQQSRERLKTMVTVSNSFSRFVPDQLRKPIVQSAVSTKVFNKRAKLTIFFSDVVGFTKLSDNLDADTLTEVLNTYMERMTLVAKKHDAVLDKFIGDGMMCFFGAHGIKSDTQNAINCVAMAMDMKREMRDLRRLWRERGFEGLYIRMGINTGYCHVGNFGSENRMSYTIVGKEVNLAARLESVAKPDQIVVSKSTYEAIRHQYKCQAYGKLTLKGFDEEVPSWIVCDLEKIVSKSGDLYDQNLPGFDIHLNFEQVKNYDYTSIRSHLAAAIERVEFAEKMDSYKKR